MGTGSCFDDSVLSVQHAGRIFSSGVIGSVRVMCAVFLQKMEDTYPAVHQFDTCDGIYWSLYCYGIMEEDYVEQGAYPV